MSGTPRGGGVIGYENSSKGLKWNILKRHRYIRDLTGRLVHEPLGKPQLQIPSSDLWAPTAPHVSHPHPHPHAKGGSPLVLKVMARASFCR